jgi:hypothetical protein
MTPHRWATGIALVSLAALITASCGSTQAPSRAPDSVAVVAPTAGSPAPSTIAVAPSATPLPTLDPAPTPVQLPLVDPNVADLTGVTTDPKLAHRLPLAVLVDDNQVARPQSGFNGASIVYQAPADGGETRYMLVFQEGDASSIGPVRSTRVYFVEWASEVHAAIAHYGGDLRSRDFLTQYDTQRFTNIDALGKGAKAFHRISSRSAPHNGYTSTAAIRAMVARLGGPATIPAGLQGHTFVAPGAQSTLAASQHIVVPYRTGRIDYRFDRVTDLYRRYVDGSIQVDPADHASVTTRNVVVLFMSFTTDTKIEPGHSRPVIGLVGTGRALVYREGRLVQGFWSKPDEQAPTRLLDAAGNEIPLVTGRTFFQIVPLGTKISTGP